MLDKFKTLLSDNKDVKEEEFEASQLAVASLMVTTALHDGEFDEIEKDEILKLLGNFYKLDNDKLNKLFEASFELVDNANDIHQFTSKINSLLTDDEKIMIIEMIWKIVIADGRIDDYENALVRKISGLLYIDDFKVGEIKKKLSQQFKMTYLVNEKCIKCKYTDCVEVCPVDCFYEGENMLVINPDECIDCGVCEPECPVDAIISDTDDKDEKWLEVNQKFSEIWPNITMKKDSPTDAKMYESEENKYDKYFSEKSGGQLIL